ncbi:hypothetical protein VTN77DRAFT_1514 [Rasamsonia byssochlamydoides]|uniref:uncharacterized protein n=1 Tax=Rasamsonia byssochlamydoides TaxID=89139 RepID=UPI00374416D8
MPMKWTTENDHILLLKILETHNITVNAAKVAAAWPGDGDAKPTPRAVSERLVKLRQMTQTGGTTKMSISSVGGSSAPVTPRKARTPTKAASGGSTKRKRGADEVAIKPDPDVENHTAAALTPSKKGKGHVKRESDEITLPDLDAIEKESPTKRVRKAAVHHPDMVVYQDDSDENKNEKLSSSGSEFVPEQANSVGKENAMKVEDDDDESELWA